MRARFEPLDHPLVFEQPRRLTDVSSWHEHIPFAFFVVAALRPSVVVELGTWKGDSYCAFCQAVQSLALATRCYAIDTWAGDEHTGVYGPEVLEELRAYHDPLYGGFSSLVQQRFDEAAASFADGSVDLLHIDGAHSYEAVAHDVETWLPKLGDRGVLLLHDTNVRQSDFGVWRLWDELSPRYPGFAFAHGHGLGVLATGSGVDARFASFVRQAQGDPLTTAFFSALGSRIALPAAERRARAAVELVAAENARAADEASLDAARARAEGAALRAESERLRAERDRVSSQLRARERDIAGVIQSPSWRLTAPLRQGKSQVLRARQARHRLERLRREWFPAAPETSPPAHGPAAELRHRPLVSIVTPVFEIDPRWLRSAVESVRAQTYPRWQLCLADDGSSSPATVEYLQVLAGDPAISVTFGENAGIAAATNRALAAAEGEFVAFLDHDDELHPDALLECVRRLDEEPGTDIVYTDEDKLDRRGRQSEPFFKPDWSPEYLRGVMYVGHLLFVRRSLVEQVGGPCSEFDGVQDFELMLRLSEQTTRIEHVPRILYHWRKLPGSLAATTGAKRGISELQAAAVTAHLERCGIASFARPNPAHPHRTLVHPKPRALWPKVTVIVPTKDAPDQLERCLRSLFTRSTYPSFEVILVDNGTTDPEARRLQRVHPVEVLPFDEPFNFSRVNNLGVAHASGELVVFLNNDTEIRTPEWLELLVSLAERDGAGAVGPLLVYPNGTVQQAGVVLGLRGTADHIMRGFPGHLRRPRRIALVRARGLRGDGGMHGDPARGLPGGRRVRRALRDALPGRRPVPSARPLRAAERLHAARNGRTHRKREPGRRLRPARSRAPPRPVGRDDRRRRSVLQPRALPLRGRLPAEGGRVNVLFVNYHDFTSNSAVHICNLARELSEVGVGCAVAVPAHPETIELLGDYRLETLDFRGARNGGPHFPDGGPPTLIHAWTPREAVRALTEELSGRYGCPYIVHLEDNEDAITADRLGLRIEELRSVPVGKLDAAIPASLSHPVRMRRLLRGAAGLTVIIDSLLEFRADGVPAEVVWPAYEEELFTGEPGEPELRRSLGIADEEAVVVYAGNAHSSNAAEMRSLYLAVAAVNRNGRPLKLIRLGRDFVRFLEPELRPVERHVVQLPLQPRSEVPRYLRLADVLVQPGRAGTFNDYRFPSKLPEFLATGRPVVLPATNLGRFLEDGEDCVLLHRGDALEIAQAVEAILDDDELRARLGGRARAFAEQNFSWQASAGRLLALYELALAGSPGPPRAAAARPSAPGSRPPLLGYATVRDYCGYLERVPELVTSGDLKDVQRPWALETILSAVPPGSRLLEIGAGEPTVAARLAALGYEAAVIDPYDGRARGPTGLDALRAAYPAVRILRGLFPDDVPLGETFDCVYSISVLEHLAAEAIEGTCDAIRRLTRDGGVTIHAVDHVLLGRGDADHRARLGQVTASLGLPARLLERALASLSDDPEAYFLSAESHDRWRGGVPYDEFPMRRCVSIQLVAAFEDAG